MTGYFRVIIDDHERTADTMADAKQIAFELIRDFNLSRAALIKIVHVHERVEYSRLSEDLLREIAP